jgi:hypothetical protein
MSENTVTGQIRQYLQQRSQPEDATKSGRIRRQSRGWPAIRGQLFRLLSRLSHLGYAIWLESCSLGPRILLLRSMIEGRPLLAIGAALEIDTTQHLVANKRTSARSRDIQLLRETYPWATVADLHLFLLGWNKGEEFAGRECYSQHSCSEQTIANS